MIQNNVFFRAAFLSLTTLLLTTAATPALSGDPTTTTTTTSTSTTTLPGPSDCSLTPSVSCKASERAILLVLDKAGTSKDKLVWRWLRGSQVTSGDLGNPRLSTEYTLCIYDETGDVGQLATRVDVQVGIQWKAISNGQGISYKYRDGAAANDGVVSALVGQGSAGRARAFLIARGDQFPTPTPAGAGLFNADSQVVVQLRASTGACWQSTFGGDQIKLNGSGKFRGVSLGP